MDRNKNLKVTMLIFLVFVSMGITLVANSSDSESFERHGKADDENEILHEDKEVSERILRSSGAYTPNFIHINGSKYNWTKTAENNDWCKGEGTFDKPYVIENCTIDASSSPINSGILIENSTEVYFEVRNCTITGANGGLPWINYAAGIKLINCTNGLIENNTCSNRGTYGCGILAYTHCFNITVSRNRILSNGMHGILFESTTNSTMIDNFVNDTTNNGLYLYSNSHNNTIINNTATNNKYGIVFNTICKDNMVVNNNASKNGQYGIYLTNQCDKNMIVNNNASYNGVHGIYLYIECIENMIVNNRASNNINQQGIYLRAQCDKNMIVNNTANDNNWNGIHLSECNFNHIINNTANNGQSYHGIFLIKSDFNLIINNTANNNDDYGYYMSDSCDNNTLDGNFAESCKYGIHLLSHCRQNNISNNIINNNQNGIYLAGYCRYNRIINNTANNNDDYGYYLKTHSENNLLEGNFAESCLYGMYLEDNCRYNRIINNTMNNNDDKGISCDTCSNCVFINNTLAGNSQGIFIFDNSIDNDVISNTVTDNEYGIYITHSCERILVANNTAESNLNYGIWVGSSCVDIKVVNNSLNSNDIGGICMDSTDDNTIENNEINDNVKHGIYINNGCDNIEILNNHIKDNDEYAIIIEDCQLSELSGNRMYNSGLRIIGDKNSISSHVIHTNNTLNEKNIYYYVNQDQLEESDFTNSGQIILVNCNNSVISNQNLSKGSIGLATYYCHDNEITDNMMDGNLFYGIYLVESDDNTVTENRILNNKGTGIYLEDSSNSNLIYFNSLCLNVRNALDNGNNDWDDDFIGNYWSNYTGVDEDGDGIGDSVFLLLGDGGGIDHYPLMNYDPLFLSIPSDLSYEVGTTGHSLIWQVKDYSPCLTSYEIYKNGVSVKSGTLYVSDATINMNVEGLSPGTYSYTLEIYHGSGEPACDYAQVTVYNTAPVMTDFPDDLIVEIGSAGNNLSWTFTDVSADDSTWTITRDGVILKADQSCLSGKAIEFSVDGLSTGTYIYNLQINDGYGKTIYDTVCVTVRNTNPSFTKMPADLSYNENETGGALSWIFSDISVYDPTYTIKLNDIIIISCNSCLSGEPINITVDNLVVGIHSYTIEINDGYGGVISDAVKVSVLAVNEELNDDMDLNDDLEASNINAMITSSLIIGGFIGGGLIVSAVVLGLFLKSRSRYSSNPSVREKESKLLNPSSKSLGKKPVANESAVKTPVNKKNVVKTPAKKAPTTKK